MGSILFHLYNKMSRVVQTLDPFFAQPGPHNGLDLGAYDWRAAQPPPAHDWGVGHLLGNGQNDFRLQLNAAPGAGAAPMQVPLRPMGFAPEEYAQMGIEPPAYLGALQRAGIVRNGRPGPFAAINAAQAQREARHGILRQGFRLGARGLAAVHPIGMAAGLLERAWGENEGEGGPAQLRRIRFHNNVNQRPFRHNEPAAAAANGTRNNKARLNPREGPRVKNVRPIPRNDPRRNAEWQAPNPNRANIANMAYVPRQANAARLAAQLHNELEPPVAAPLAAPQPFPRNGTAAGLLSPPQRPTGFLGRMLGALGIGAAALGSGATPSLPVPNPSAPPNHPFLHGGKTRRTNKKLKSRGRSYRK